MCSLSLSLSLSLSPSLSVCSFFHVIPIKVNPHVIHKAKTRMEKDKNEKNHLAQRFIGQLLPTEITQVGREDTALYAAGGRKDR